MPEKITADSNDSNADANTGMIQSLQVVPAGYKNDSSVMVSGQSGFSFVEIANLAVAIAIIFAAGMSVFYIFAGGISFILSGGQEDKIKQAVHTIRYAIIGLIVTILAVTIIAILGSIFDFDLVSYISWAKITTMMERVMDKLSTTNAPNGGSLQ